MPQKQIFMHNVPVYFSSIRHKIYAGLKTLDIFYAAWLCASFAPGKAKIWVGFDLSPPCVEIQIQPWLIDRFKFFNPLITTFPWRRFQKKPPKHTKTVFELLKAESAYCLVSEFWFLARQQHLSFFHRRRVDRCFYVCSNALVTQVSNQSWSPNIVFILVRLYFCVLWLTPTSLQNNPHNYSWKLSIHLKSRAPPEPDF